jgi:hypothetical protein
MKRLMKLGKAFAFASAVGLCLPGGGVGLRAAEPAPAAVEGAKAPGKLSLDVIVSAKGELRGAAVNADNAPSAGAKVSLRNVSGKGNVETNTDKAGHFLLQGVRPGVYSLTVNGEKSRAEKIVRVWWQESAPPAATPLALVQLQSQQAPDVVRGQIGGGYATSTAQILIGGALIAGGAVGIVALAGGFNSGHGPSSP